MTIKNSNWTDTIQTLSQIAYGNMTNKNITSAMAKKELQRMAQQHDLLVNKQTYNKIYQPKFNLVKLTADLNCVNSCDCLH